MMESKWWLTAGSFFAEAEFEASASGTVAGNTREVDLEGNLGLGDSDDLFMGELGWQFGEKWGMALQYFRSSRSASKVLDETVEWQGETYDVGAQIDAGTTFEITRLFFARQFRDRGPHSLRLGAGLHLLGLSAEISGQARIDDMTTEFRRAAATADVPIPNIGAWYRYSPNDRWLFNLRVDWLSASIDNYSGGIWNVLGGVNFRIWDHFGVGAAYEFFQISGDLTEDNWHGSIESTYSGPYLYLSGYW